MQSETINRYKKARKVAEYLLRNGVLELDTANLNDFFRGAIADGAQVNPPSDETWALIEYLLWEASERGKDA